jgi:MFS family permease
MIFLLRNRNFLNLWLVNIAATMAIELFSVTILVTVFEQTGSTLQTAGTMVSRTLVAFLLGPLAGVLVDRFPRKNVLIGMDLIRLALVGGAVWFLLGDGNVPVLAVYLILAGLSAAEVFHRPARLALIPSLVPRSQLVGANSFMLASYQIILAVSYTVGGWLIMALPLRQIALVVGALFALAVLLAARLVVPKRRDGIDGGDGESYWRSSLSGWRYLRRHPIARPLIVMETAEHIPHGIWTGALMLAFTFQALRGSAPDWGYQVTGYFSGMILGSLGGLAIGGWLRRFPGRIIVANAMAAGLLTLAYATSQTVWLAVVFSFVFGPPQALRDIAQDALLQSTVEDEQLGRVYATREMLLNVSFMFSGLFFAWLSDLVPIRAIYVIGGIFYILTGIYAHNNKPLRESRMDSDVVTAAD